ncbi:hypothetical protein RJ640_007549 [Escallonia rubra]|uniref:Cytochrome P450 n=1 Tax=Escallonia rubra TaxID=112253 RepID=A0AA88RSX8_9ASTE|nr:hypothetical protein RJ640_007549 [Escallonia rubra]
MDLILLFLVILGLLSILSFSFVFLFGGKSNNSPRFPPGKTGWPLVGEAPELVALGRNGTPDRFVRERMEKFSPEVFKTSLAGETMAVFCGASGNKFLFSNENKLIASWWPPTMEKIITSKDSQTNFTLLIKKLRKILLESLKPEALQKYVPIMDCIAMQHLEREWSSASNNTVKAFPLIKKYTFELVCRIFMSIEDPNQVASFADKFAILAAGLLAMPIDFPGTTFNRAIKAANFIRKELSPILKERRDQLAEKKVVAARDLLSQILITTDEDGKHLTEMEVSDMILGILEASHDTVSTVITFVLYYLADHPDVYAQVLAEQKEIADSKGPGEWLNWDDMKKMKYSRCVLNEVMRLQSPSQGTFRQAITDFTYAGFSIPKGWKVFWSVYSTHKDPKYFSNPEEFDPSRFDGKGPLPYTFVPFGGGPSMCPGGEFARLEALTFMHRLVTKFKWERLNPNEKIISEPAPIPADGLPIRLFAHDD